MIYFNGSALEDAAPVMIEDIRVSPIPQTPVARDRPLSGGAAFIRAKDSVRTVGVTFSILEQDPDARQRYIEAVTAWALSSDCPAPLTLPYHMGKYLNAVCTGLPEPSARQWWETRLSLTFTAFDPYFYDIAEKTASCGTAFYVGGSAPPKMRIETTLNSQATLTYSDGVNTMTFSNVPTGNVVIDLTKQTAQNGGVSIMDKYGVTSRFIIPRTGNITITGTGTVKWREAWKA